MREQLKKEEPKNLYHNMKLAHLGLLIFSQTAVRAGFPSYAVKKEWIDKIPFIKFKPIVY
jgi:hypothetical protein